MKKTLVDTSLHGYDYIDEHYPNAEKISKRFQPGDFEIDESLASIGFTADDLSSKEDVSGFELQQDGQPIAQVAWWETGGSFYVRRGDELVKQVGTYWEADRLLNQLGAEEDAKAAADPTYTPADVFYAWGVDGVEYYKEPITAKKTTIIEHKAYCGKTVTLTVERMQKWERHTTPQEDKYIDEARLEISVPWPSEFWKDNKNILRIEVYGHKDWIDLVKSFEVDESGETLKLTTEEMITMYDAIFERLLPEIGPLQAFYIKEFREPILAGHIWYTDEEYEAYNVRKFGEPSGLSLAIVDHDPEDGYVHYYKAQEYQDRFPEQLGLSELGAKIATAKARRRLGAAIKEARKAAGLSIHDLAARSRMEGGIISRLEGGRANAGIDDYAKLAAALGLEINITPKG